MELDQSQPITLGEVYKHFYIFLWSEILGPVFVILKSATLGGNILTSQAERAFDVDGRFHLNPLNINGLTLTRTTVTAQ